MSSSAKSIPVTQLVKLGGQAPTFELPVTIGKLDGTSEVVTLPCKAMRKTEWAALRDAHHRALLEQSVKPAEAADADAPEGQSISAVLQGLAQSGHEASIRKGLERDADLVLTFVSPEAMAEGIDAQFLMGLEDAYGGSLSAILLAYDLAIYHGRLGN